MFSKAHRLLMKLVMALLLLKKSLISRAKWVVNCTVSVNCTSIRQSRASVTTK